MAVATSLRQEIMQLADSMPLYPAVSYGLASVFEPELRNSDLTRGSPLRAGNLAYRRNRTARAREHARRPAGVAWIEWEVPGVQHHTLLLVHRDRDK